MPYTDIIILALVAGFILLRLRGILGQNHDMDERPPMPPKDVSADMSDSGMLSFPQARQEAGAKAEAANADLDKPIIDGLDATIKTGLEQIKAVDPSFSLTRFLEGAKAAFELVLKAFNANDRGMLTMLLAPTLAEVFVQEAEKRAGSDNKAETTLVSIVAAEVRAAELVRKTARITLGILSEQVHVVRDKEGKIIEGNPSQVERVEDEWIFERDVTSKNPNWMIVDT